jgi:hypothetical protein
MVSLSCGIVMVIALAFVPCSHSAAQNTNRTAFTIATLASPDNSNFVARIQKGILTPRQRWNLKTTVGAYEQFGQRDPKWDAAAIEALETFALSRGMPLDEEVAAMQRRMGLASDKVRSFGCSDPMIHYLWLRFNRFRFPNSMSDFGGSEYGRCAQQLAKSGYPPVRKFGVCIHSVERYHDMRSYPPEMQSLVEMAAGFLKETLSDKEMPEEDAYLYCESFFNACRQAKTDSHAAWIQLELVIKEKLGQTHYGSVLEGLVHLQWAWAARGTGYANTITEEGWKLMTERLALAQQALDRAWKLNPKDWRGPNVMMEVVFLDSGDRDVMEKWFQRAMQNNPDNFAACAIKLNFMTPRWGGSGEALVAFGRHCLTNTLWTPLMAEILPKAYGEAGTDISDSQERREYWARKEVWTDVKAAYEKLFHAYPNNPKLRKDLEHWGFLCGRKEEAERILAK